MISLQLLIAFLSHRIGSRDGHWPAAGNQVIARCLQGRSPGPCLIYSLFLNSRRGYDVGLSIQTSHVVSQSPAALVKQEGGAVF
jgi:hypothetical protein